MGVGYKSTNNRQNTPAGKTARRDRGRDNRRHSGVKGWQGRINQHCPIGQKKGTNKMRRCLNCGIASGIKKAHNFCHSCGGTQFEATANNKNQDLASRVKTLEKEVKNSHRNDTESNDDNINVP